MSYYKQLNDDFKAFLAGTLSSKDLKHTTAPFGIYEQKDGNFMIRVRTTGGLLGIKQMKALNTLLNSDFGIEFAHLSTRQNIQLQNVPAENVCAIVEKAVELGLVFRGGGGNTYRNVAVSPEGTFSASSIFDVQPYAKAIQDFVFDYEKAYVLPRKLKISLSCNDDDSSLATLQDLGFIATIKDGIKGFKVFSAGGMGRESAVAIKVIDFVPATEILNVVAAVIDLFYYHGNRENRNKARLRFFREKVGDAEFQKLFTQYVNNVIHIPPIEVEEKEYHVTDFGNSPVELDKNFEIWKKRSNMPTSNPNATAVNLFVPFGNFTPKQFNELTETLEKFGNEQVQLTSNQNMIIPFVTSSSLAKLYEILSKLSIDLRGESFYGLVQSCIGSNFCKIGVLNAPLYAKKVATILDAYFADKPELQAEQLPKIISSIKISGCHNSCGAHHTAKLGFQGLKRKIDDKMTDIFYVTENGKVSAIETKLGEKREEIVKADEIDKMIENWLNNSL